MTKKILLKWLEARKAEALAQVDTQEAAAKAALLAEKLERTKFAEMVAYVEPRLTEVYNYMMDWHKKNEKLAGPLSMSWGTVLYSIHNVLLARVPTAKASTSSRSRASITAASTFRARRSISTSTVLLNESGLTAVMRTPQAFSPRRKSC